MSVFSHQWQKISNSPWINLVIREGLKLRFQSIPGRRFVITDYPSEMMADCFVGSEVFSLLEKKVLVRVPEQEVTKGFYSTLFLVKKPNVSFRTIINLVFEPVSAVREISYGIHQVGCEQSLPRLLYGYNGPEGCVLSCLYPSWPPDV